MGVEYIDNFCNLENQEPRALTVEKHGKDVFGEGRFEKVTSAYPARRVVLDGVAGRAEASNHGIIQVRGYVYEGRAQNGYLFITGNADALYANEKGTIFLKKDPQMGGDTPDKKQKSGSVRVLCIADSGYAVIEGNADEVTIMRGGRVTVEGDVKIARIEEYGEINVHGKIDKRYIIRPLGYINIRDATDKVIPFRG